MAKIEWDDSLSVGVDLIDEQHKMLIQKLKELSKAFQVGLEQNKMLKTIDFLIDYTDFHFSEEEKLMAEHNYPGLEIQQKQHREFQDTLNYMLEDYQDEGPTKALATSINVFMLNWLVNHIKGLDVQIGKFLSDKANKLD
ncbi:bacteriohemerythrin [Acidobacteriota bacterium]